MKQILWPLCLTIFLLLTGCRSATVVHINPYLSFHDELFPEYQLVDIESETEVFEIGQVAKTFVDQKMHRIVDPVKRIKALAEAIFNHADLNLLYKNDANTVANDTFNNRAANCLSLTIMTYALAEYADMGVRFQQVLTPDLWVRREGTSLLNRHINLRLYANTKERVVLYDNKSYQLDFDRRSQSFHLPIIVVDKQRVLAMFYNNKGAEALIKGNHTKAYAYFRSALTTDSLLVEASTNLGILYRRAGRLDYAESTYQQALAIDKDDSSTWENLAYIYNITDRKEQANSINNRIQKQRKSNPFYHFMLGEIEYEKKAWQQAINHFRAAIDLDANQHEFYFALAKSYYQLGEIQRSQHFLKLAKKHSRDDNDELLYQSKLDSLN